MQLSAMSVTSKANRKLPKLKCDIGFNTVQWIVFLGGTFLLFPFAISVNETISESISCPVLAPIWTHVHYDYDDSSRPICALVYNEPSCGGLNYSVSAYAKFYDFNESQLEKFKDRLLSAQINPGCNLTFCSEKDFGGNCSNYIDNAELTTAMTSFPLISPAGSLSCYCYRFFTTFAYDSYKIKDFSADRDKSFTNELDLQKSLTNYPDQEICAVFYKNSTIQGHLFNLNIGEKRTVIPTVLADLIRYGVVVNERYFLLYCTESNLSGDCDLFGFGRFRLIVGRFPIRSAACIRKDLYEKPQISSIVKKLNCIILTDNLTKSTIENHYRIGRGIVHSELFIIDDVIVMTSPPNCILVVCTESHFRGLCYVLLHNSRWYHRNNNSSEIVISVVGSAACNCDNSLTISKISSKTSSFSTIAILKKRFPSVFTELEHKDLCIRLAENNELSEYQLYIRKHDFYDDLSIFMPPDTFNNIYVEAGCTVAYCSDKDFRGDCGIFGGNRYWTEQDDFDVRIRSLICYCGRLKVNLMIDSDLPFIQPETEIMSCAATWLDTDTNDISWIISSERQNYRLDANYIRVREDCTLAYCTEPNFYGKCGVMEGARDKYHILDEQLTIQSAKCACGKDRSKTLSLNNTESLANADQIVINSLACRYSFESKLTPSKPLPLWSWMIFSILFCSSLAAASYWYWRTRSAGKAGRIDASQLEFLEELGAGQFGAVYRGIYKKKRKNHQVALKIQKIVASLPKTLGETSADTKSVTKSQADFSMTSAEGFFQEVLILNFLRHPNVIVIYGICVNHERAKAILVLELMNAGSCIDYISKYKTNLSHSDLLAIADHVAKGCQYITDNGILHCDISARNILVETLPESHKVKVAKITDFGVARDIGRAEPRYMGYRSGLMHPIWTAPEAMKKAEFSPKSDVWSFGVFLWELYAQLETPESTPYSQCSNQDEIMEFIDFGNRLNRPDFAPVDVFTVAEQCWAEEPSQRPSFKQLINSIAIVRSNQDHLSKTSILYSGSTFAEDESVEEYEPVSATLCKVGYEDIRLL